MKYFLALAAIALTWPLGTQNASADDAVKVKVLSFNIRYDNPRDGKNQWSLRRAMVSDLIRKVDADFVGLQEAHPGQWAYLKKKLPQYGILVRSSEAKPGKGAANSLFYRKSRWQPDPQDQGTFWLSKTPNVPGSISWGSRCRRIATWARFTEKDTGREVYVYNTHLDHVSKKARLQGALLLGKRIAKRRHPNVPVLLMGDFNTDESSSPIRLLKGKADGSPLNLIDTFRVLHPKEANENTYHAFTGRQPGERIDFIFASPALKVTSAAILRDNVDGRYPSDHFPVVAEVALSAK